MNVVSLTGRTTGNIELKKTSNDNYVSSFTLAVERAFKVQDEKVTDFISCVAWGKTAETMSAYVNKGDMVGITGRLQTREYDDKEGVHRYITEVVVSELTFLQSKKQESNQSLVNDDDAPF